MSDEEVIATTVAKAEMVRILKEALWLVRTGRMHQLMLCTDVQGETHRRVQSVLCDMEMHRVQLIESVLVACEQLSPGGEMDPEPMPPMVGHA